jgi:hypothetical protein
MDRRCHVKAPPFVEEGKPYVPEHHAVVRVAAFARADIEPAVLKQSGRCEEVATGKRSVRDSPLVSVVERAELVPAEGWDAIVIFVKAREVTFHLLCFGLPQHVRPPLAYALRGPNDSKWLPAAERLSRC